MAFALGGYSQTTWTECREGGMGSPNVFTSTEAAPLTDAATIQEL